MSTDFRALCAELADALDHNRQCLMDDRRLTHPLADKARAALARWGHQPASPAAGADCPACEGVPKPGNQPCAACGRSASSAGGEVAELAWWLRSLEDASVWFETGSPEALKLTRAADLLERHPAPAPPVGEGPTEDELWDIGERHLWTGTDESATNYRILTSFIEAARAVLARYGHQPAPVAAGEVGELVAWLRDRAESTSLAHNALRITRAADLLEQHHPAPVPVAERLPSLAEISAWVDKCRQNPQENRWCERVDHHDVIAIARAALHDWTATALPLPAGEVK